ncbi:MAG: 3'(2'),5'-bisphosphate nucleotidase CysQ [Fidelibacterota bacterium]
MKRELKIATEAARKAGDIILRYYRSDYAVLDKSRTGRMPTLRRRGAAAKNPVTTADHASNDRLKEILLSEFPDYGWLSEETVDSRERLTKERVWVVDPLDGTKEFIEGVPNFVVSVALVENHHPIVGVLFNPVTGELFASAQGQGATLNGDPIRCSSQSDPGGMEILMSRTESRNGLWRKFENRFRKLKSVGSVSYKLGLTAAGRGDVFASLRPKNEWDVCGGHCLVAEAGGIMVSLRGEPVTYNNPKTRIPFGLVAGNPEAVNATLNILTGGKVPHA